MYVCNDLTDLDKEEIKFILQVSAVGIRSKQLGFYSNMVELGAWKKYDNTRRKHNCRLGIYN